jgi:hypothetical protein
MKQERGPDTGVFRAVELLGDRPAVPMVETAGLGDGFREPGAFIARNEQALMWSVFRKFVRKLFLP